MAVPVQAQSYSDQTVSAFANIFGAGNANTPSPGGYGGGTVAPEFSLTPGSGRILTFSSVTQNISFTPGTTVVPDGLQLNGLPSFGLSTNVLSYQGISGIQLEQGSGFLTGVFLSASAPAGAGPSRLGFTNNGTGGLTATSFASLAPVLNQTFFIGDGLTGNGAGSQQVFYVPDGATRLFLGYADGYAYSGLPGAYYDNAGATKVSFSVSAVPEPETYAMMLAGLGLLGFAARRRASSRT